MKIIVFFIGFFAVALYVTLAIAGMIEVKTGYGYIRDKAGNVIAKAELPAGQHRLGDDYEYVEVRNKAALNRVDVWEPPESQQEIIEKKIQKRMRSIAINQLKLEGQIPGDYKE